MDRNYLDLESGELRLKSLSARRAWIEISACSRAGTVVGSLSARRAWIEIAQNASATSRNGSLSARRAWIEISNTSWAVMMI